VTLVERARPDVLDAIARDLCKKNPGSIVTLTYLCLDIKRAVERYEADGHDLCREVRAP
jgi:hypothetical protein